MVYVEPSVRPDDGHFGDNPNRMQMHHQLQVILKPDPGNPQEDNLYELTEEERAARGIEFLPRDLQEAIDAFAADPFVVETLGQELRDEFIRYKVKEWESYHQTVSDWEVERYSHLF